MKKACTIGSATKDLFIMYEGADILHLHQKRGKCTYMLLEQGTKIDVPALHSAPGGGGANVAVGLARLGLTVEPYFRTGNDSDGTLLRTALQEEGIATQNCPIDEAHSTALSIIIPSIENDHVAFCHRGANRHQTKEEFPMALLKELGLLFFGPLGGISQELLPFLAPAAHNAGVSVALNPSMTQLSDTSAQFIKTLKHVDTLIINTLESGHLMRALLKEEEEPHFVVNSNDGPSLLGTYLYFDSLSFTFKDVVQQILACGPRIVVITNGAEGVYVATQEMMYFHASHRVDPVYSLGAGDAFTSAFLGAQTTGLSITKALQYGIINAISVIGYPDAQKGLLDSATLEQRAGQLPLDTVQTYRYNT